MSFCTECLADCDGDYCHDCITSGLVAQTEAMLKFLMEIQTAGRGISLRAPRLFQEEL